MGAKRRPYFRPEDFAAFDRDLAENPPLEILRARKVVAEGRMKPLHTGFDGEEGLQGFMHRQGLEAHWAPGHPTNVYWQTPELGRGSVDAIWMGYGKPEHLVKELAHRSGVGQTVTSRGSRDAMAFHQVTQVQLGLDQDFWWIDWYQDRNCPN